MSGSYKLSDETRQKYQETVEDVFDRMFHESLVPDIPDTHRIRDVYTYPDGRVEVVLMPNRAYAFSTSLPADGSDL